MLSTNFIALVLSYKMQDYRPRGVLSEWKDILGFSSWLFFNNILFFLTQHTQNFILGKFGGSNALGLFAISNEIGTLTTNEITAAINRAAYPAYAKLASDKQELKASYIAVYSHIALISLPSAIGIAATAPLFVPILLGDKWTDAIAVIQIIAVTSAITSLNTNAHYIYLAQAKQKITTLLMILWLVIFVPSLLIFAPEKGVIGAVNALFISSATMFPINQIVLKRQLGLLWRELAVILYRPTISSMIMGIVVLQCVSLIQLQVLNVEGVFWLFSIMGLGVVVFSTIVFLLWLLAGKPNGAEKEFLLKTKLWNWSKKGEFKS
jgi:PST family polysaccharide transporter